VVARYSTRTIEMEVLHCSNLSFGILKITLNKGVDLVANRIHGPMIES